MPHTARKRFGQHFLTDFATIEALIRAIQPQYEDHIVEIGPGLGALTRPLRDQVEHLHVIEIDRDIVRELKAAYPPEKVTVHESDALRFDFAKLGGNLRIIGNLPYNISTPLLFHLISFSALIKDLHVMLQKEVVERMVARPATTSYGKLSVMLQYRFDMECLLTIPAICFRPQPKVESAFVRLNPRAPATAADDEELFSRIVSMAFAQRRKTLLNNLKSKLTLSDFGAAGIDPKLRAQDLSLNDFVRLANYVGSKERRYTVRQGAQ